MDHPKKEVIRAKLEELIEKLQPMVGHIKMTGIPLIGDEPDTAALELHLTGKLSAAIALWHAKTALTSSNPEIIALAYIACETELKHSQAMAHRHALQQQYEAALAPRRAGGRTTGAHQHSEAEKRWPVIGARYSQMLAKGMKPPDARRAVSAAMRLQFNDDYLRKMLRRHNRMSASIRPDVS